jgi:hypothetical protein
MEFGDDDVSASGSEHMEDEEEEVYGDFEDVEARQQPEAASAAPPPLAAAATAMPDAASELSSDSSLLHLQVRRSRQGSVQAGRGGSEWKQVCAWRSMRRVGHLQHSLLAGAIPHLVPAAAWPPPSLPPSHRHGATTT